MGESIMNKAQELIKWFSINGDEDTSSWDIELLKNAEAVVSREIVGQGRWETYLESVYKFTDNSHVRMSWNEGSTEYQDCPPGIEFIEVEPYEETIIKYRNKINE